MRVPLVVVLLATPALGGCTPSRWLAPRALANAAAKTAFRDPLTAGQLVIHADFYLPPGHRMVSELTSERQLIADALGVPVGNEPIHVFLFADEAAYRAHVARKFPNFPERRAIFVETDVQLSVYAHWSDHVADDLRHEVAHGYLHATAPNLPLWLDEGLAEYFEVGRGRSGVNEAHVEFLRSQAATADWQPNLARLEQLTAAETMTQLDYAESWLWVHYLLESRAGGRSLISKHLGTLRKGEPGTMLSAALSQETPPLQPVENALISHLQTMGQGQKVDY